MPIAAKQPCLRCEADRGIARPVAGIAAPLYDLEKEPLLETPGVELKVLSVAAIIKDVPGLERFQLGGRQVHLRFEIVAPLKDMVVQEFPFILVMLVALANDIVSRPHARLGATAMATLEAIGRTLPLDVFGLDFDVDEDGRVVFFEANPSMNLLWTGATELAYPRSAEAQFLEGVERLLERKAATRFSVH